MGFIWGFIFNGSIRQYTNAGVAQWQSTSLIMTGVVGSIPTTSSIGKAAGNLTSCGLLLYFLRFHFTCVFTFWSYQVAEAVKDLVGLGLCFCDDMGIDIAGGAGLGMAQLVGDYHQRRAVSDHQTGVCVPEEWTVTFGSPVRFTNFVNHWLTESGNRGLPSSLVNTRPSLSFHASPRASRCASCQRLYPTGAEPRCGRSGATVHCWQSLAYRHSSQRSVGSSRSAGYRAAAHPDPHRTSAAPETLPFAIRRAGRM